MSGPPNKNGAKGATGGAVTPLKREPLGFVSGPNNSTPQTVKKKAGKGAAPINNRHEKSPVPEVNDPSASPLVKIRTRLAFSRTLFNPNKTLPKSVKPALDTSVGLSTPRKIGHRSTAGTPGSGQTNVSFQVSPAASQGSPISIGSYPALSSVTYSSVQTPPRDRKSCNGPEFSSEKSSKLSPKSGATGTSPFAFGRSPRKPTAQNFDPFVENGKGNQGPVKIEESVLRRLENGWKLFFKVTDTTAKSSPPVTQVSAMGPITPSAAVQQDNDATPDSVKNGNGQRRLINSLRALIGAGLNPAKNLTPALDAVCSSPRAQKHTTAAGSTPHKTLQQFSKEPDLGLTEASSGSSPGSPDLLALSSVAASGAIGQKIPRKMAWQLNRTKVNEPKVEGPKRQPPFCHTKQPSDPTLVLQAGHVSSSAIAQVHSSQQATPPLTREPKLERTFVASAAFTSASSPGQVDSSVLNRSSPSTATSVVSVRLLEQFDSGHLTQLAGPNSPFSVNQRGLHVSPPHHTKINVLPMQYSHRPYNPYQTHPLSHVPFGVRMYG